LPASSRHATRIADAIEQFGVFELALPSGDGARGADEGWKPVSSVNDFENTESATSGKAGGR